MIKNKTRYICVLLLGMVIRLYAMDSLTVQSPSIVIPRELAMGGTHITDTLSYYSFIANPANIPFIGKRFVIPSLNMQLGGPLNKLPKIMNTVSDGTSLIDSLLDLVSEGEGLHANAQMTGPLAVGQVRKYTAWGAFNTTYIYGDVPSLTASEIYAGESVLLLTGCALAIPLGFADISAGINIKGFADMFGKYTEAPTKLNDFDFSAIPAYTVYGGALDVGFTVRLWDILSIGAMWKDAVSLYHAAKYASFGSVFSDETDNATGLGESALKCGIGVSVPVQSLTRNTISSWTLYIDCTDVVKFIENDPFDKNRILFLSFGTEFLLFNTFSFRAGISETYPAAGLGIAIGIVNLDFSFYGRELGLEPGACPQMNAALGFSIHLK